MNDSLFFSGCFTQLGGGSDDGRLLEHPVFTIVGMVVGYKKIFGLTKYSDFEVNYFFLFQKSSQETSEGFSTSQAKGKVNHFKEQRDVCAAICALVSSL